MSRAGSTWWGGGPGAQVLSLVGAPWWGARGPGPLGPPWNRPWIHLKIVNVSFLNFCRRRAPIFLGLEIWTEH